MVTLAPMLRSLGFSPPPITIRPAPIVAAAVLLPLSYVNDSEVDTLTRVASLECLEFVHRMLALVAAASAGDLRNRLE